MGDNPHSEGVEVCALLAAGKSLLVAQIGFK